MPAIVTRLLILITIFLLGFFFRCSIDADNQEKTITTTKIDTIYKTVIDSVPYQEITKNSSTNKAEIKTTPDLKAKTTLNKGVKSFENLKATLHYEIYADNLYGTSFKLELEEHTIVKNIENKVYRTENIKPKIFFGGGLNASQQEIQDVEIGMMYNHKQKWIAGIVINQNLNNTSPSVNNTSLGARFYIPL